MIFKRLIVGSLGTNCYLFGSERTKEVVIIDPGGNANIIIKSVMELNAKPIAILLTHGHFDHTLKVKRIKEQFQIPLMYNIKEFQSKIFTTIKADKWLNEGDSIAIGEINLNVLETPGHSPGSLCFYTSDIKKFKGNKIGGFLFSGDLLFRRSIGRTDIGGGDQNKLFTSIREKIMFNSNLNDSYIIFPGHMEATSIAEERNMNMFRKYFL